MDRGTAGQVVRAVARVVIAVVMAVVQVPNVPTVWLITLLMSFLTETLMLPLLGVSGLRTVNRSGSSVGGTKRFPCLSSSRRTSPRSLPRRTKNAGMLPVSILWQSCPNVESDIMAPLLSVLCVIT